MTSGTSGPVASTDAGRTPLLRAARDVQRGFGMVGHAHVQTILGSVLPVRPLPALRNFDTWETPVAVDAAVRVRVSNFFPHQPMLLLVHGFTGSSDSSCVLRAAVHGVRHGYTVARVDLRNAGGTHSLSRGLFNMQQWRDLGPVLTCLHSQYRPPRLYVIGFSLGGTLILNLLGRAPEHQEMVEAVVAINPPIDIPRAVGRVGEPRNRFYTWSFLSRLHRGVAVKRRLGHRYPDSRRIGCRTVPEFDRRLVLPETEYSELGDYYEDASAIGWIERIRTPMALIASRDDPLVPAAMFAEVRDRGSVLLTDYGGHLGHLELHRGGLRPWAAEVALRYFAHLERSQCWQPQVCAPSAEAQRAGTC